MNGIDKAMAILSLLLPRWSILARMPTPNDVVATDERHFSNSFLPVGRCHTHGAAKATMQGDRQ